MSKIIQAHDFIDVSETSKREVTDEGFLVIRDCTIARCGIQEYRAYELGLGDVNPMQVIRLFRPPEEVFAPDSLRSFENKPITNDHPPEGVNAKNWKELAKGDASNLKRGAGDLMKATLTVKSEDMVMEIESGKKQLSNGYNFRLDMTPGTDPLTGQAYDGVQRHIRGNHVAVVKAARCGSACSIADSDFSTTTQGVNTMADATRKVIVDGIPVEVNDTAAAAIDKLVAKNAELTAARDEALSKIGASITYKVGDKSVTYTGDQLAAVIKEKDDKIAALEKDVMTPEARDAMVADWAKMTTDAKRLAPDVKTEGKTCHAVRKEVLTVVTGKDAVAKNVVEAVLGTKTIETADAEQVRAAFKAVAASTNIGTQTGDGSTSNSAFANAMTGDSATVNSNEKAEKKLVGRDAMLERHRKVYQEASK